MNLTQRIERMEATTAAELLQAWADFWQNFTDCEVEALAKPPEDCAEPGYLAIVEKARALGFERLAERSAALGGELTSKPR